MGILVLLFGLIIGSFLNCLIWRLYKQESLSGRSYCPKCRHKIHWYDNVPVLSFLFLRGRCRYCRKTISIQYPLVEIITALLFLFAFLTFSSYEPQYLWLARAWLIIAVMMVVFIYDLRWQLVSVMLVIASFVLLAVADVMLGFSVWQILIWSLVGAGFYFFQYILTKKKGVGQGDIWLGLLMGAVFPLATSFITAIFLAYIIGAVTAIILMIMGKKRIGSKLPMGVFLALSAVIVLFFGNSLSTWYLSQL